MEKELLSYVVNYKVDKELEQILIQIENKDNFEKIINYKFIKNIYSQQEIIENGRNFFNEYFNLQNIYYYPKTIHKLCSYKKTIKILNSINPESPLDIPFTLNKKSEISCVEKQNIYINDVFDRILIKNIIISNSKLANEFYAHEIAHTQQPFTNNMLTDEIIPIFLEKLAGQYFNHENLIEEFRLNEVYSDIYQMKNTKLIPSEKVLNIQYIESTLKAYLLYHLYQTEALSSTRARIIDEINELFSKQTTIENILTNHGITNNNYKTLTLEHKIL